MREIPKKNYLIYAIVIVVSVGLTIYFMALYNERQQVDVNGIMSNFVSEVHSDEISSYLLDNPNTVIYVAPSDTDENKTLEKDLKSFIVKKELTNEFVYLDSSQVKSNTFYQEFADKYLTDDLKKQSTDLSVTPNLIYVKEGKIVDTMNTIKKDTTIDDVKQFLEKNGVY